MSAVALLGLLLAAPVHAADPLVAALRPELDRAAASLTLPGAPGPHLIQLVGYDIDRLSVEARLGALLRDDLRPARGLAVGVRVGTPDRDSTNFVAGWGGDGFGRTGLVHDDHAPALRQDAWLLTDRLYRRAVETLAIKEAAQARSAVVVDLPDCAPPPVVVHDGGRGVALDAATLRSAAREVSAVFRDHPAVEWSTVLVAGESGRRVILNSLGSELVLPYDEVSFRTVARVRAPDGTTRTDHASHLVRSAADLPSTAELRAEAEALAERLERWSTTEATSESYVGPVIFEGAAAVSLFRHLLMGAFNGTPPEEHPPDGSRTFLFSGETGDAPPAMRPLRRILPPGFDVDDDPLRDPALPSSFTHDVEGVPAEPVVLVRDGIVRRHLASTIPSEHEAQSNGHARGSGASLPRAMASNLRVQAASPRSSRRLRKQAMRLAADYELDHVVVVRRVADPSIERLGRPPALAFGAGDPGFPAPVEVVRVYADGREELVRGWRFGELDRRLLRDIAAAGPSHTATVYGLPTGSRPTGPSQGAPVTLTVPDVLVTELELRPGKENAQKAPPAPSPLADAG
jgi:predicted Zn-dependent protease